MNEKDYDELLHIQTEGNKHEVNDSIYYHPYEPTPYSALECLFKEYEMSEQDCIVDFGCGKGRLNFYLHYLFHSRVTGIEMNETFYREALENKERYLMKLKCDPRTIQFHCCKAEQYEILPEENKFYFFNPFSIQIFMRVVNNILRSFEAVNRDMDIILYYASDEYRYFLEYQTSFELIKEIEIPVLNEKNAFERFLIYRLRKEW